jgi:cystathionine gamma-lyase
MANQKQTHIATRAVHSGDIPEDGTGSVTTGIFPSSTYRVKYPGDESGYVYSRSSNPTRNALERALADLEGGSNAYAFSSGLAAVDAVLNLLKPGDHVVAIEDLYGGTMRQFEQVARRFGLEFSYVDGSDAANFESTTQENTRLYWLETPTNPLLQLVDIAAVAKIAKGHGILTAVDSTFATPIIQQPLSLGTDIVLHSASKYLGGHCDVIGGAVVVNDPDLAERIRFNQYAIGAILGPFESWLILRGLKTLPVRMERHAANAAKIAAYLQSEDLVTTIYYPGLDGQPLPNEMSLAGGMVSFVMDCDLETVKKFATATTLFILAESLGGVESLINHPALMTHASIPREIREPRGIGDGLIRLSVGLEHVDDLIADLQQAFRGLSK